MKWIFRGLTALLLLGVLLGGSGCKSDVETSTDYQKLNKQEADKRFEETQKRRAAAGRMGSPPGTPAGGTGTSR